MKKAYLLLAVILGLVAFALAAPDFSGTWVLNAEKSGMTGGGGGGGGGRGGMGGGEMVIKQSGNELTITQTFGQNAMETKYILDDAEHTVSTGRGDMKYKATWKGESIVITGTRTTQRGEMPINDAYSLSANGKELTITSTTQQGERKRIYDKK